MRALPAVEPGVLESARGQAGTRAAHTVGGILVGRTEGGAVTIERAVPAEPAELHEGELVFTPGSWDRAYAELERAGPGARIVGWYHAHPSHGLALSDYDRMLHRTLFSEPSQVALVLDPATGDVAWFGWEVERIAPLAAERTGREQPEANDLPAAFAIRPEGRRRRIATEVAAALIVAAVIVGAYLWGASTTRTKIVARTIPAAGTRASGADPAAALREAQAEQERLRAQLGAEAARVQEIQAQLEATREKLRKATRRLQEAAARPGAFVLTYRVRPGDSLYQLAQVFYGTGSAWERIWRANPTPNPDRLLVGSMLKVPLNPAG